MISNDALPCFTAAAVAARDALVGRIKAVFDADLKRDLTADIEEANRKSDSAYVNAGSYENDLKTHVSK